MLADRGFEFPVERAIFLTVLHRLMVSGSDRACEQWRDDYRIDGVDSLQLHHLYRAMAWLGEELPRLRIPPGFAGRNLDAASPANGQVDRTLVARRMQDLVEERLFARRRVPRPLVDHRRKDFVEERLSPRRRSLFSDLSVVFMDTTSLYFEGEG